MVNTVHVQPEAPDTRTRLLAHAREVYLEGGAAHFSLREVARRVGISAAAVYRHFDSKDALLGAVCEEGFRTFLGYLLRSLAEKTPRARLGASGDLYLRFALENEHDYRFIFMSSVSDVALGTDKADPAVTSSTFLFLVDRVRECTASGDLREGDPAAIAATIWAHVHGLASLRLAGHLASVGDDEAFAAFFRRSTDDLIAGLGR